MIDLIRGKQFLYPFKYIECKKVFDEFHGVVNKVKQGFKVLAK